METDGPIGILITGDPVHAVRSRRGDFAAIIAKAIGARWPGSYRSIDARHELLDGHDDLSGLIITGSAANVPHREPWMLRTEAALTELVARGLPILGICFGHQLLAQALGGQVERNPRGREMSTVRIDVTLEHPLLDGLGDTFEANACHVDTVTQTPPGTRILAHSSADDHQALCFAPRCFGVQFHPEFDRDLMRSYVDARSDQIQAEGLDPAKLKADASETPLGRRVLDNFILHFVQTH